MLIGQSIKKIRHESVVTPERALQSKRCSRSLAHNKILQRLLPDRGSEHIQAQTDHEVKGLDVYCRRWCFVAHDGGEFQKLLGAPIREWHRPFHNRGGARHFLVREVTLTEGRNKPSVAAPTYSFLSSRSLSRKLLHLPCTTPSGETLCQKQKWRKPC